MNRIFYLTALCIVVFLLPSQANGTDYFLSPSGNDSSPGTSQEKAWKSIGKVISTKFKPGDRILFQGGQKFVGSLNFDITDSGTAKNPVTVCSYGKGRAKINSGSEFGLYAKNTSGFVVKDLIFTGAGADVDCGRHVPPVLHNSGGFRGRPDARYSRLDPEKEESHR